MKPVRIIPTILVFFYFSACVRALKSQLALEYGLRIELYTTVLYSV